MKTYLVFTIQGYSNEGRFPDGSLKLEDVTLIKLIDTKYSTALKRAEKIINKSFYRLSEVNEFIEK